MFLRGTKFQICTAVSAGLLPPLRQTARWLLGYFCLWLTIYWIQVAYS